MSRRHILPPQTTALERAVDQTVPTWGWMADSVAPGYVSRDPAFTSWLALDWQVAQFAPYFDTAAALLIAALPWLRGRGSAASVRAALGWIGWHDVALDEDGAWLHLDLGRIATHAELLPLAHVVRASIPAHVRFYRMFHGWDARMVRFDDADGLDAGLLDDDSGVWVDVAPYGEPLKVSQGQTHSTASGAPRAGQEIAWRILLYAHVCHACRRPPYTYSGATLTHEGMTAPPPRLSPLWPPPAAAHIGLCLSAALDPATARTAEHGGCADRFNEDSRSWTGGWNGAPWRSFFLSRTFTED
jgi:hypothetical protein